MRIAEFCHVTARGNNKEPIVWDEEDKNLFVGRLGEVAVKYRWIGFAYCLMTNHYHLVVHLPHDGLSEGIQALNSGFARRMNRRHERTGHLFQQRFESKPILDDVHLRESCRYVALNPVRAAICNVPEEHVWSSHRAVAGLDLASDFLHVDRVRGMFGRNPESGRSRYLTFVAEGRVPVSDTGVGRVDA